ncbi:MAG: oxidoreductase [Micrococcales bacterium 73-13]|nr:MAG: oxidoreductase [Micrococcales bacterium 73-13]
MTARDGRLGVGVIGAGRVGPVLAAGLAGAGHRVVGVATTSATGRDRVEALLGAAPILPIPELLAGSDLVILAIPGGEIGPLVRGLAESGHWRAGTLVAHTAPELGVEALRPAVERGAIPLAIHPAIVFTGTSLDLVRLREAVCAVTAPTPVLPIAQALVVELGAEPVVIAEADRPAYAEAVATATAFSASIVGQSLGILAGIGVDRPSGIVAPLIRSTIEEALAAGAVAPDEGG